MPDTSARIKFKLSAEDMKPDLSAAKLRVSHFFPYFSSLLFSLVEIEVENMMEIAGGPIGVDFKGRIYYDPVALREQPIKVIAALLLHELNHLIRQHKVRGESLDHKLWNIAGDYEINDDLQRDLKQLKHIDGAPFELPKWGCYPAKANPPMPEDLSAEQYYELLLKRKKENPDAASEPVLMGGMCGSCSGNSAPYEMSDTNPNPGEGSTSEKQKVWAKLGGEVKGLDAVTMERLMMETAEAIETYSAGSVPSSLKKAAKRYLKPVVAWEREVQATCLNAIQWAAGQTDFTYQKSNHRQYLYGRVIMPSMGSHKPIVAVCVDTSGSMNTADHNRCLGELDAILKRTQAEVHVITGDTVPHFTARIKSVEKVDLVGGGGTDMSALYYAAGEIKPKPQVIIVMTDGETPWPQTKIEGTRSIVLLTRQSRYGSEPPSWMKVIKAFNNDD